MHNLLPDPVAFVLTAIKNAGRANKDEVFPRGDLFQKLSIEMSGYQAIDIEKHVESMARKVCLYDAGFGSARSASIRDEDSVVV